MLLSALKQSNKYWPFFMWLFPLYFFAYQFILRLWPSLMMQPIMEQFQIGAMSFGLMASVYYYGYAGMQIPVALLLDRYDPRRVIFGCALVCGIATAVFNDTDNWYLALISRFLIGAGSAAGFLSTSKVISQWFPKESYARMVGFSFTFGLLGAIYGGRPVSMLVEYYGQNFVAYGLALTAVMIGLISYFFLRSPMYTQDTHEVERAIHLKGFKQLLSSPFIWILALANLLMVGALEGFSDVWGVNYLMTVYHLSRSDAATLVSFIFVGMLFGGPILAFFSKRWGNYLIISFCGFGMAAAFLELILIHIEHIYFLGLIFFIVGVLCCYQVLIFAAGNSLVEPSLLGITVAFLNCVNMLGGSFFHTVIGFVMDMTWTGKLNISGVRQYTEFSYECALITIPLAAIIGAMMVMYLRKAERR